MITSAEVQDQIAKAKSRKAGAFSNLIVLLVSLALFASFGLFQASPRGIVVLVLVLFIHEAGHYLGMRMFGYRDVQMFFIPFFGAAVSGKETKPGAARQAIVSLLGPLPGVVLGALCGVLYFRTQEPVYREAAQTFLFINGFNLLPLHPLDGGRVLEALFFARHPRVEIAIRFLAVLGLGGLAFIMRSVPLAILAFFQFGSLKTSYAVARLADRISRELETSRSETASEEIPPEHLERMLPDLEAIAGGRGNKIQVAATWAPIIWMKARQRPPSIAAGFGLFLVYAASLLAGIVLPLVFVSFDQAMQTRATIEQRLLPTGEVVPVEVRRVDGIRVFECAVNSNGFYSGQSIERSSVTGAPVVVTFWRDGFLHGAQATVDIQSNILELVHYDMGRATQYQKRVEGSLRVVPGTEWPGALAGVQQEPLKSEVYDVYRATVVRVGDRCPDFSVRTLDGATFDSASLSGRVAWIHFFAISNKITAGQTRQIEERVWSAWGASNVALLVVARDSSEDEVRAYAAKAGLTCPVAADPGRSIYNLFANGYVPRNFLIGRDGIVVDQRTGLLRDEFEELLVVAEKLLSVDKR